MTLRRSIAQTLLLALLTVGVRTASEPPGRQVNNANSELYKNLQLVNKSLQGHDFDDIPPSSGGPTIVYIDVDLKAISNVRPTTMDYTVDVFLTQMWNDTRVTRSNAADTDLALPDSYIKRLWTPDAVFANARSGAVVQIADISKVLKLNAKTGRFTFSQRVRAEIVCSMDLAYFPFDHQQCEILLESFRYDIDLVELRWMNREDISSEYIERNISESLPSYDVGVNYLHEHCTENYTYRGSFSCLKMTIAFYRNIQYFIFEVYIPSLMMVIITWMSFWIERRIIQARTALGGLTMVAITNQINAIKAILPKTAQTKSVDVWLWVCQFYVLAAFLQFGLVNWLSRRDAARAAKLAKAEERRKLEEEKKRLENLSPVEAQEHQDRHEEAISRGEGEEGRGSNGGPAAATHSSNVKEAVEGIEMEILGESPPGMSQDTPSGTNPPTWRSRLKELNRRVREKTARDYEKFKNKGMAGQLDIVSRALFPGTFAVFIICYWGVYIHDSQYEVLRLSTQRPANS